MRVRLLCGAAVLAVLAGPTGASGATRTLSADRAVDRSCTAVVLPSGTAGVVRRTVIAGVEGTLTARLTGRGDWDLAAFDRAGTLIAGSSAFRADELVKVNLRKGAEVTLQACRVSGAARTVKLTTSTVAFDFERLSQTGASMLVEVPFTAGWQLDALERLGLDVTHDVHDGRARVLLHGDRERTLLQRTGLGFDVVHPDVNAVRRRDRAADRAAVAAAGPSPLPTGRETYRTFEEVQSELKAMQTQFPDLVKGFTFKTKTFEGRDIQAVEITRDVGSEDDTRPVLYLNGIHHAREWPATEVILEFAWDLLKNHRTDPKLARILDEVRVVVQPYTNVDGFVVSRGAPNLVDPESAANIVYSTATGVVVLGGSLEYKRKNCNPYPLAGLGGPCEINLGTDNNRNYPHTWGGGGASTNPNDQSFRGVGPGSEPETKAVQEFQLSVNAPVLISMHNIAAKVLRPPGTQAEGFAPDEAGLLELGRRMAEPTDYANERGFQLYDVTGGTKDWAYAATGAYGYTVETGPADGDFHGAYQSVVIDQYLGERGTKSAGRGMREALIAAALWTREETQTSRIRGRAPAGRTLRITKGFDTLTSAVCSAAGILPISTTTATPDECVAPGEVMKVPERIEIVTKVPASGRFTWWLNPSKRPYSKVPEAYTLTCEDGGTVLETHQVTLERGQTLAMDLPCGGTLPDAAAPGPATAGKKGLSIRRVAAVRGRRALRTTVRVTGTTAKKVVLTVTRGGRVVGTRRLASLRGTRTVTIRLARRLPRGRYTVTVRAAGLKTVRRAERIR
jgi:hypothetical protein